MEISTNQLMDYCYCSQLYNLKYNQDCIKESLTEKYDRTVKLCFYAYLQQLKNHSSVELNYLMKLWGKNWIRDKSMIKIMTKASANNRDRYDSLRRSGVDSLISFHKMIRLGEQYPILINYDYKIEIAPNLFITGKFEYVREFTLNSTNRVFQIIKFNHRKDRYLTAHQMRHDIELTANDYAFRQIFNSVDQQMVYMNIYKERFTVAYRSNKDFEALKRTAINVAKCISNDIYNISPDSKCFMCSYRNQCGDFIDGRLKSKC